MHRRHFHIVFFVLFFFVFVSFFSSQHTVVAATTTPFDELENSDLLSLCADPEELVRHINERKTSAIDESPESKNTLPLLLSEWDTQPTHPSGIDLRTVNKGHCGIERIPIDKLTPKRFQDEFFNKKPVIVNMRHHRNFTFFRDLVQRGPLLFCYGDSELTLASSGQYSKFKVQKTLSEYLDTKTFRPMPMKNVSNEQVFIQFGPWNAPNDWFDYFSPKFSSLGFYTESHLKQWGTTLSFGIAPSGTGVQHHTHASATSTMIFGAKRWFVAPYNREPKHDPDASMLEWVTEVIPTLTEEERAGYDDCLVEDGETIYFPTRWWHGSLNVAAAIVSMSEFA